ncbi:hypothetical protein BVRB_009170 [Beta vulgaris subsp. vulgaris]|uniref:High-affinity nitrate transporter n=1 Tax=Beta vulgaris subsp. vulgaris TaxID=3555 RepID=A0A0J8B2J0_BETVV|nr:high-affinity nitrate transporter 3.2 [Beta vulgaris subsp. vulgaris]KMS95334.1 hypothetical protein BVRB_009170 [Beta vulgaris subsp. vulgaris]
MGVRGLIIFAAVLCSLVATCYSKGVFADLRNTLTVSASPSGRVDLRAGIDQITVSWRLNRNISNTDSATYSKVDVKLCYHLESQKDRPWRRTEEDLSRDKTCQFSMVKKDYNSSTDSVTYTVKKNIPTAHYFVRVYVRNADNREIAYGQTNGLDLNIKGISGRSTSIDVAASVFSGFSVLSLAFFFFLEKRKAKKLTS